MKVLLKDLPLGARFRHQDRNWILLGHGSPATVTPDLGSIPCGKTQTASGMFFSDGWTFYVEVDDIEPSERIKELEYFTRSIATNWDCDEDAHKYGTECRQCEARAILNMP